MGDLRAEFDRLQEVLRTARTVVVTGHENADGDAVGAVAALRRHLELEDKHVTALLTDALSPRYGFMEFATKYAQFEPGRHVDLVRSADVFIMCDLSSPSRLGVLEPVVAASRATTVCFDHHPCEDGGPGAVNLLDPTATATGCIVYDYIRHVGGSIDREIAESVFVSLSTDTGWFRYPNTNAQVMELVAELAQHRLDLPAMYRAIYQSNSPAMVRLMGHVARTMNEECDGVFVWAHIRQSLMNDLGVGRFETDPILDVLRSNENAQVVALFTQQADGRVAVSLRSRGDPDVNAVARQFGGGGHVYAAGTTLPAASAERDQKAMIAAIRQLVG